MNAARITHISYYMISMFSALNAASFVLGTVAHGIMFAFTMILMMFFMSFLIIFFTTILYGILLRFFNGEKLKDILNVLQIILSVITVVGYQVLGRMFEFVDMNLKINIQWWSYLLPSAWFGGLFKVVVERNNDNYGHLIGDEILKEVAGSINQLILRSTDAVFRFGGDEFVVVLYDTDNDGIFTVAERIHNAVSKINIIDDNTKDKISVTISVGGFVLKPMHNIEMEYILAKADRALYKAKENGRNQIHIITE